MSENTERSTPAKPSVKGFKFIDRTGQKFGRLTVLKFAGKDRWGQSDWLCLCECGTEKVLHGGNLAQGAVRSCGCLAAESVKTATLTHGATIGKNPTPEYRTWVSMKDRCYNPKNKRFHRYGGRGIQICKRWDESFESFLSDMGDKPTPKHTIHRVDNDGNYEPGNCIWATQRDQARARSSNHLITFRGETMIMIQWAEKLGMSFDVLSGRFGLGWSVERALTQKVRKSPARK